MNLLEVGHELGVALEFFTGSIDEASEWLELVAGVGIGKSSCTDGLALTRRVHPPVTRIST